MTRITALYLCTALSASAQISVLSNRYDNARTGTNLSETVLTTSNVNSTRFGKLYSYPVDGSVFSQPLYVPSIVIGKGSHNVLYVCTMNDSVYAFDADQNKTLWSVNFTNPAAGITPVPIADITGSDDLNIVGSVGIESTPVIDASTQTLYLVARTKEVTGGATNYVQRLHALDITTGAEKSGSPVAINASVPGTGEQSSNGMVPFNSKMNNQRSGLALANGQVIITWASHEDDQPYHGWVMAYSSSTLAQTGVFCVTPNGIEGGVWQSGRAPVVDAFGDVYLITGNGTTDKSADFGESVLRFSTKQGLTVTDYFTASNANSLNGGDLDLGASGLILLPKLDLLIGGGKQGIFYLLNPADLGHYVAGDTQIPQKFSVSPGEIKPGPAYWVSASKGPLVYLWGEMDYLKAFHYNGTNFDTAPLLQSTLQTPTGEPGATITISASGTSDASAIVWASMAVSQDADHGIVPGMLRAISATNPTVELWNSLQVPSRDDTGIFAKFTPPIVVNGKVYMASFSNYSAPNYVNVYGLLALSDKFTLSATPAATNVVPGATATVQVTVNSLPGTTFAGTVNLSVSGLPTGVSATFNPTSIKGLGSSTLSIATSAGAALGSYPLTITGQGALSGVQNSVPLTLNVSNTPGAISLNFVGTGTALTSSEIAGVVPKANWNNLSTITSTQPQPLVDEFGNGTAASAAWSGQNLWMMPIAGTPADFTMMQGYLDDLNGGTSTFSVTGLIGTPNGYQVYVYTDGDNSTDTRVATYTVSGPGVTTASFTVTDEPNTNFSGTYNLVTASQSAGNYVVFTVAGNSFTVTAEPISGGVLRAPLNGVQIVPAN